MKVTHMNLTVQLIEGQPRVHDLMLGERLRFERPRKIRDLIERNRSALERHGKVCSTPHGGASQGGGLSGTEYWLNEAQALVICTKSDTAIAEEVVEEIIKVFIAWRHGELAPVSLSRTTLAAIGELFDEKFDPICKKIDRTHTVVEGTDGKIIQLLSTAARIEQRVEDVVPRKDPSEKNKRIYIHTVAKRFDGLCPCGCRQPILDDNGIVLLDQYGQPLLVYDHYYTRERNGIEACWPVHRGCNNKLKDDDYRRSKHSRFEVFHQERKEVQGDVSHPAKQKKPKVSPTLKSKTQLELF